MVASRTDNLERFWSLVNQRKLAQAVELYHPDAVVNLAGTVAEGRAAIQAELERFIAGFPDVEYVVTARHVAGDAVIEEWVARGTHSGDFMGRPPSGKSIRLHATTIYEFASEQVVADRTYLDMSPVLVRTGVLVPAGRSEGGSA